MGEIVEDNGESIRDLIKRSMRGELGLAREELDKAFDTEEDHLNFRVAYTNFLKDCENLFGFNLIFAEDLPLTDLGTEEDNLDGFVDDYEDEEFDEFFDTYGVRQEDLPEGWENFLKDPDTDPDAWDLPDRYYD